VASASRSGRAHAETRAKHGDDTAHAAAPADPRQPGLVSVPCSDNGLLSGNHRLPILRELGYESAPVVVVELDDAQARLLADGYRAIYNASGDIIRIVTDAAAAAPGAAEFLATANERHHEALVEIVTQIRETGDLKKDLSDEDAARIIYYHFRYEQFTLAADTFGWGEDRALDWIRERVENALLDS
jgi:hypothetical protein